ncbi:MAG: translation initiation factor eIF-2B [Candidatus Njordarchaeia archaeon]
MNKAGLINHVKDVSEKIKKLEIRGATTIAIKAVETVKYVVQNAPGEQLERMLIESIEILKNSRPTEPAMYNGLTYIYTRFRKEKSDDPEENRKKLIGIADTYLKMLFDAFYKIIEVGSKLIPDDSRIMTHCHSSTVTNILKKAFEMGKTFEVISSETRPRFQGRKTTKELAAAGIKVYHIVDSSMRWAARRFKPDLAMIGADAITSIGTVINKIGSKLLALVAKEFDFPFYIGSTLLKLDIRTMCGENVTIEMRDPSEIWEDPPENVVILNPAFETVSHEYIDGIISEVGIIPPNNVLHAFKEKYPYIWSTNFI